MNQISEIKPQAHNLEAEQSVIGALLVDASLYHAFADLTPAHFAEPGHAYLWAVVQELVGDGRPLSVAALKVALRGNRAIEDLDEAACGNYLFHLAEKAPAHDIAQDMADVLRGDWVRRGAIEIAQNTIALASASNPRPAADVVSYLRRSVDELESLSSVSSSEFQVATDVGAAVVNQLADNLKTGKTIGKKCGIRCVDYRMGGFHPGSLIIVGGRPSMGKTALARAMAHGAAVRNPGDEALFLGIEMGPEEMMQRELSAISSEIGTGIEYRDMAHGNLTAHDIADLHRFAARIPRNLILKDCPSLSLEDVRRAIWTRRRKATLSVVVIDYLQILRRPEARGRNESAVLGEITAGLKQIARQAGCAIVLLSQLSRQVETREDKRPQLSDLRESGSIEQDADFVLFPFREVYYLERMKPAAAKQDEHDVKCADLAHVMEVICAKARRASVGADMQTYIPEYDHIKDRDVG